MTVKDDVARLVGDALAEAQRTGVLPTTAVEGVPIERPQNPEHGDYACSLPLKLAKPMRMSPMAIGEKLVALMPAGGPFDAVQLAPPGFINVTLSESWLTQQVDLIRRLGAA